MIRLSLFLFLFINAVNTLELKFLLSMPITATGGLGMWSDYIMQMIQFVVDDVNEEVAFPAGHTVSVNIQSSQYSSAEIVNNVVEASEMGSLGVIGELKYRPTTILTMMAQKFNMYTCSGSVTSLELSDKQMYPLFIRTIPTDDRYSVAKAHFIKHMGWSVCSVLASAGAHGRSTSATFLKIAKDIGIQVATAQYISLPHQSHGYELPNPVALNAIAESGTRLIIYFGDVKEYFAMAPLALKVGIIGPDWVWIAGESFDEMVDAMGNNAAYFSLTNGLLYLTPNEFIDTKRTASLLHRIQQLDPERTKLEPGSGYISDCVYALTHMFVNALNSPEYKSKNIMDRTANLNLDHVLKPFRGITGIVDASGKDPARHAEYLVMNLYRGKRKQIYHVSTSGTIIQSPGVDIQYYSGTNHRPPDRPLELIMYLRFNTIGAWLLMILVSTLMVIVFACTAVALHYRHSVFVKEAQAPVLVLVGGGIWLMLVSIVVSIDVQSSLKCSTSLWSTSVGFQLVLVPLLYRAYSTWIVLDNSIIQQKRKKHDMQEILACFVLFMVQIVILSAWTLFAPLKAKAVTTRTSFYYVCESESSATHALFEWTLIAWNVLLLGALSYFTMISRNLTSPARVPRYTFFVASNLALCMAVLSPLYIHHFPEFALGSFWVHVAVTLFACTFTLGMTHVRVVQLIYKPEPDPYSVCGSDWTLLSIPGMPNANVFINQTLHDSNEVVKSASVAVVRNLVPVSGRGMSYNGDFAVKKPGLLSTWRIHRVLVALEERFLGLTPLPSTHASAGVVVSLKCVRAYLSKRLEMVVEVYCGRHLLVYIQFRTPEQVGLFLTLIAD